MDESRNLNDLYSLLQQETSFENVSPLEECRTCENEATMYLHPLEDQEPQVACETCSKELIEARTHREYPIEPSSTSNDVTKQILNGTQTLLLMKLDESGIPMEDEWLKMANEDVVILVEQQ